MLIIGFRGFKSNTWSNFVPFCKKTRFSYISYCFLQKNGRKQTSRSHWVSPKLLDRHTLDIVLPHRVDSSHKAASVPSVINIKFVFQTRYASWESDRYSWLMFTNRNDVTIFIRMDVMLTKCILSSTGPRNLTDFFVNDLAALGQFGKIFSRIDLKPG